MKNLKYLNSCLTIFNIILSCKGNLRNSYFAFHFGYRLHQRMIESYVNYTLLDCVGECLRTTRCKSVNYYKGANFCETNFQINTAEPVMYRQNPGWVYTAIKDWNKELIASCSESSCAINEKCIPRPFGLFQCVLSDCGIPSNINNTTWNLQDGDGIGIYKQMHMKCSDWYIQQGSGAISCLRNGIWKSHIVCKVRPIDCKDLLEKGHTNSGVYEIYPYGTSSNPIRVYCDMETMGGGWTAIQKRVNGSLSFDRIWTEYKKGFGDSEQNIWIGNDVIHQLTRGDISSLYISITLEDGTRLYEMYDRFSVSSELEKYKLFLAGNATGTLGDSIVNTKSIYNLSGMYFTTPDRDNDRFRGNCAIYHRGGWWYNGCFIAFLNGPWSPDKWTNPWYPRITSGTSVTQTMMMIKRH